MKKLTFILIAAAALAACSNDELIDGTQGYDNAIVFGNIATRAAITSANDVTEFGVWARMNTGDDGTAEADVYVDLLENERVYKNSNLWTYDNIRYWVDNRTFHFFALHYLGGSVDVTTHKSLDETGYYGFKVDFTSNTAADVDLMTAYKTEITTTNTENYPTVHFSFDHLLACIDIKVNSEMSGVSVTGVELDGVNVKGIYSTSPHSSYTSKWTNITTGKAVKSNLSVVLPYDSKKTTQESEIVSNGSFLIIPQELNGSQKLTLNTSREYESKVSRKSYEVVIPNTTVTKWEAGKKYVYTLTIKSEGITFNEPSVVEWDEENATGSVIIK